MPEIPRVLTVALAERIGIGRARVRTELRRGNWQRIAPGVVLTRPDGPTRFDWAEAGVLLAGPDAAVTGWEALRAIGLGDRTPPAAPPVVLMPRGLGRQVGQVRLRRTSRSYVTRLLPADADRLALTPIVPPPRSIADAALQDRDATRLRALVTSAISRRVCRVEDLLAELEAMPRQRSAPFRLALADAVDGARSVAEAVAARRLARAPVPAFELNVPVVRGGTTVFVVDVLWRELRAALEIDSREYHFSEAQWKATMRRHNALLRLGLALAHYPPSAIDRPGWTDEVAGWLRARARELGVPYVAGGGVRTAGVLTFEP